ncbi:MAG: SusD/RagB family nutrient-binding outer membrane lipoprotein [Chlorobi bacterium]|nr:SusD/RagB family nutrient-binding outer membrane lipoprotein [Chlorobiota bacterium]
MKKYLIISLMVVLAGLTGCKESFFDVNKPSDKIDEDIVTANSLLPYIQYQVANLHFSIASATAQYSQQLASYHVGGVDNHERTSLAGAWSRYYTSILSNLRVLRRKADELNSSAFTGIAQVLEALATQMATDQWGDIPYTEAGYGTEILTPKVDPQSEIYSHLLALLDSAIVNLDPATATGPVPGAEDLFYGGNVETWQKLAYTIKARIHLHLMKRNGDSEAREVLAALQNGITSNAEDAQVFFGGQRLNPWYTWAVAARNTGNLHVLWSDQLISYMNDSVFIHFDSLDYDPRLPLYADNGGDPYYLGAINGSGASMSRVDTIAPNTDVANDAYFTSSSPILIVTNMEARFMEAEARLRLGQRGPAYQAYLAGIRASFEKLALDPRRYLAEPSVNVGAGNLTMAHIMVQKYIALVLHPEIWSDLRRHDFDPNVYPDLEFPVNRSTEIPPNEWPRRAVYPESEVSRNPNLEQITEYWLPVWWDE